MKSLMYHYVRDFDPSFPYFAHKEFSDFKRDVRLFIRQGFSFGNISSLVSPSINYTANCNHIYLTFDDGFKDHLRVARFLYDQGINKATFYIPSFPLVNASVLSVHKAHFIRGRFGPESLTLFYETCDDLELSLTNHENCSSELSKSKSTYTQFSDSWQVNEFKRLINYYGEIGLRDEILDHMLLKTGICINPSDLYLSISDIQEISKMGFEIGSHSYSHTLLSRLSYDQQLHEISSSLNFLQEVIDKEVCSFCYPYGGSISYNDDTLRILALNNFTSALSVDYRDIEIADLSPPAYHLPRYDCNLSHKLFPFLSP